MQKPKRHISAQNLRDWIILFAGLILVFIGVIALLAGVKTEGEISIKFLAFAGKIISPSAGLFLIFFGTILICISKFSLKLPTKTSMHRMAKAGRVRD